MKTFLKVLGILLIIAGAVMCNFTDVPVLDYTALALEAFGFAMTIIATWKKSEKKDWTVTVSICLFAIGGFLCAFSGFTEGAVSEIILAVSGLVSLILGLLLPKLIKSDSK